MQTGLKTVLLSFTVTLGLFGLATTTPAHALVQKTAFQNVTEDGTFGYNEYTKVTPYHVKSTKKSAYMWNDMHTQKLHNLKNYLTYTWYQTATATKGGSKWVRVSNFPGTKAGWVWAGYLTKGYNSKGYQVTSKRYGQPTYAGGGSYHVADANKNAYLWDWSHTKVRANLKNYTNQNFYRRHSIRLKHNGKEAWYSYVSVTTKHGTVSGYVAASLLTAGKTTNHANTDIVYPDDFTSTADYLEYIQDSNYQKLTRAIMALFPNTPVDLGMSQIAAHNYYDRVYLDGDDGDDQIETTGYTSIVPFTQVSKYLFDHRSAANATKIAGVKKLLDEAGYTQTKRNKLTGYKLGIYNINNIAEPYLNYQTKDGKMAWYSLAIGKKVD